LQLGLAAGERPADRALVGGRVLNVFTGAIEQGAVGIADGRIAWVESEPGPARETIDVEGGIVVPGLVDAHCHIDHLCTPSAFVEAAALRGTTAAVADTHLLVTHVPPQSLAGIVGALERAPMKLLWGAPPPGDTRRPGLPGPDAAHRGRVSALPGVSGSGELTAWRQLLAGEAESIDFVATLAAEGLRVDGHAPGASARTLSRLLAAGVTSDHEALTGDDLERRVRLGLWTMVRHSTLRPDGVELGGAIAARGLPHDRILLTGDNVSPRDLPYGHLDRVVRKVVEGGVDAVAAIRMATLHPAVYLGLDAHLGAVTPGRCADVVVVDDVRDFRPRLVLCDGVPVRAGAAGGGPVDWGALRVGLTAAPLTAARLAEVCRAGPPIRLDGVLARRADTPGDAYVALVSREGTWLCGTMIAGVDLRALATSLTGTQDVLLLGRDAEALVAAYERVLALGGAMACADDELPLPVFGHLSTEPVPELAAALARFERSAAYPPGLPQVEFLSTFLTTAGLPGIVLTADGVLDVRRHEVLAPVVPV
jgi:adenine deaminase